MEKMKVEDVRIPYVFLESPPKTEKVTRKRRQMKNGSKKLSIVVTEDGCLVDGFVSLLLCLESGADEVNCLVTRTSIFAGVRVGDVSSLMRLKRGELDIPGVFESIDTYFSDSRAAVSLAHLTEIHFTNQRGKCYICGGRLTKLRQLDGTHFHNTRTLDHLMPRVLGGENTVENTAVCCYRCNQLKGQLMDSEAVRDIVRKQREWEVATGYAVEAQSGVNNERERVYEMC